MGADRWDEQVGSVADEAAKLLESLRRSAESAGAETPRDRDRERTGGGERHRAPGIREWR